LWVRWSTFGFLRHGVRSLLQIRKIFLVSQEMRYTAVQPRRQLWTSYRFLLVIWEIIPQKRMPFFFLQNSIFTLNQESCSE
jgi:hypothetical protein